MKRRASDKIFMQFCSSFFKAAKTRNSADSFRSLNIDATENNQCELRNSLKDDPYAPLDALYLLREDIIDSTSEKINKILKVYKLKDGGEEEVQIEEW